MVIFPLFGGLQDAWTCPGSNQSLYPIIIIQPYNHCMVNPEATRQSLLMRQAVMNSLPLIYILWNL